MQTEPSEAATRAALLPCPFCGREAKIEKGDEWIRHAKGCAFVSFGFIGPDEPQTYDRETWNKRAAIIDRHGQQDAQAIDSLENKLAYAKNLGLQIAIGTSTDCPEGRLQHDFIKGSTLDRMFEEWSDSIGRVDHGQQWQDIATAPKDRTAILVNVSDSMVPVIVQWDTAEAMGYQPCWVNTVDGEHLGKYSQPTHWMPLPNPPGWSNVQTGTREQRVFTDQFGHEWKLGDSVRCYNCALPFAKPEAVRQRDRTGGKSLRETLDWPTGHFRVEDSPGEHDPCFLIGPNGLVWEFNHHAVNGFDQTRAQWFADTLNAALGDENADVVAGRPAADSNPTA